MRIPDIVVKTMMGIQTHSFVCSITYNDRDRTDDIFSCLTYHEGEVI